MEQMPMGATIKAVAVYDEPFWRNDGCSGEAVSTAGPLTATFDNTSHDGKQPALMGFVVGKHAREMSRLAPDAQRQGILAALERFFGPKAGRPKSVHLKDWQAEGYIGGCYVASMAPGAMTRSGPALRAWAGRLGFAGTETARQWNGYMAGALESAERAAGEVMMKLRDTPHAPTR
jgi:monoamine oxidase